MSQNFKTAIVIQARLGSSRLPKKIFLKINKKLILDIMMDQLVPISKKFPLIIATTNKKIDDEIVEYCKKRKIYFHRGSEKNVLKRYFDTSCKFKIKNIIRLTSDCPLVDPNLIEKLFNLYTRLHLDYITTDDSFPDGTDVEIINFKSIKKSYKNAKYFYEKEHPTQYIHNNKGLFKIKKISNNQNLNNVRYTIDNKFDYKLLKVLLKKLKMDGFKSPYKIYDIINCIFKYNLNKINEHIVRNEGLIISKRNEKKN